MPRYKILFIAACWLLASPAGAADTRADCLGCHPKARAALTGPMSTRASERAFAHRAFGQAEGDKFFEASCNGCHVSACSDCHGVEPHRDGKPKDDACLGCHRGYFVGWDSYGRAPREDHARYRRGAVENGEPLLKMLPDIHRERGMTCADCHPMKSLHGGQGSTRTCIDCHPNPSRAVPEHSFDAHMKKMECVACHAAWAPQEYGTFLVRPKTSEQQEAFSALPSLGPWKKSAYLRRQDAPPLGLNARGKVAPIRPQFILFATDPNRGWENRLLVAEWKAFSPHTIRRGTVTCSGCHEAPRRFLLEKDADRLHLLDQDGLALRSFWSQAGQRVTNGAFFPEDRYTLMNRKTPEYVRQYLRQWQNLLDHEGPLSKR
jgi:hypothetical protein